MGPAVELEHPFPKTSPDQLWAAVQSTVRAKGLPVDSLSTAKRRLVSGWVAAPEGSTDCGSYREVPAQVDPFEEEEYRVRITVLADGSGGRVRVWSDHRAVGWYGEVVDDCVTTGRVQEEVRSGIVQALGSGTVNLR